MKVTFGDKQVIVKFWHGVFDMAPQRPKDPVREVEGTECVLYTPGTKAEDSDITGVAYCSKRDQFNKRVGRKLSLQRAIEAAVDANAWGLADEKVRCLFWEDYNKQIGAPFQPYKEKAPKVEESVPDAVEVDLS